MLKDGTLPKVTVAFLFGFPFHHGLTIQGGSSRELTPSNSLTIEGIVVLGPTALSTAYCPSPSPLNELALDEEIYGKCLKIRKPFINVHYHC